MIIPLKCTTGKDLSIAIETMKIPLDREREPEYVPREFYARNPRGFENLVNFTPGDQNRHRVEGSNLSRKNLKAPFLILSIGGTSFKDFLVQFELIAQLAE